MLADNITVNVQSSIRIEGAKIVRFDPFQVSEALHDADIILITHAHFDHLDPILDAAAILRDFYAGTNSLYRSERDHSYSLVVHKSGHTPEEFNKVCNILTEYGSRVRSNSASEAFLREHWTPIVSDRALQTMAGAGH